VQFPALLCLRLFCIYLLIVTCIEVKMMMTIMDKINLSYLEYRKTYSLLSTLLVSLSNEVGSFPRSREH